MQQQWLRELQESARTLEDLEAVMVLSPTERQGVIAATKLLKMQITPHILSLMDPNTPNDPIRRQFLPSEEETVVLPHEHDDVNRDDLYSPTKGIVHRYPTKALLMPTTQCGAHCRFCFRRKYKGTPEDVLSAEEMACALSYVRSTPALNEIIISGGDPLVLPDDQLERILCELRAVPHIKIIRLHTRLPITVPSRVTDDFIAILRPHKPVYVVLHINHPRELSPESREAIGRLVDNGVPCLSQTALLRGVNDDRETLKELFVGLVEYRVKPYYLFHTDPIEGLGHFRVSMRKGMEIMRSLYDRMSGLAYPLYVFNVPGGRGHVLLLPSSVLDLGNGRYQITTFEGDSVDYVEDFSMDQMEGSTMGGLDGS